MRKSPKIRAMISALFLIFSSAVLNGCSSKEPMEETQFLLGTVCTVTIYDNQSEETMKKVFDRIKEIDDRMSANKAGTEVDKIAEAAGKSYVKVSEDTFYVIEKGKEYSEKSGGIFDISIGPLVKLWGIGTDSARVPSQYEIDAKKSLINYRDILLNKDEKSVMLKKEGMMLDLGGIAKGYAADEAARILKENKVEHAIINLGGNVVAIDNNINGKPWNIGIQNPFDTRGTIVGSIAVTNKTVVTSGIYERYLEVKGVRYHHILNPFTGYPMESGLASVTIVTDSSIDADAMTKNLFYSGVDKGLASLESTPEVEAIFITRDKKVYVTEDLRSSIKITNMEYRLMKEGS
ncbi:MAG: FAD:protein FMN transferase [Clostridiaceae bacterium]